RATVGAIEERIAIASVGGIVQLGQAIRAGSNVRRDEDGAVVRALAGLNPKRGVTDHGKTLPAYFRDAGQRRPGHRHVAEELVERCGFAFDLDADTANAIAYEAVQVQARGQAVDERPKADALDNTMDRDGSAFHEANTRVPQTGDIYEL